MRELGNTAAAEEYEAVASGKKDSVDLSHINGKAEGNEFKLFNESESGTAVFPKLIFNITHL